MNIGFDNAIAFVMIFGILVFLHELGHFLVAKYTGIRVEVFSLGFGPRLVGWRHGATDYRISLVPLGGYVKMLGEEGEMELVADPRDAAPESEEPAADAAPPPDAFSAKTRWQRFLVMVAGGVMNLILAVLILAGVNMAGREEPAFLGETPRLAGPVEGSPAAAAGLEPGDTVVAVDGTPTTNWESLQQVVLFNPGRTLTFTVEREGERLDLPVNVTLPPKELPQARYRIGYAGLGSPAYDVRIWRVVAGSPAERAGLQEGDFLLAAAGEPILDREDVARIVSARPGETIAIKVRRGDAIMELTATPEDRDGKGLLGVDTGPVLSLRQYSPLAALKASVGQNIERVGMFFTVLGKLLTGGLSVRAISGPVDIFIFSGAALRRGWIPYLDLMALFSLQLGILNLLPVPFLDGGHIAVLGIEGVLRRDLSVRLKERILQIGFVGLILLMGLVLYSDIAKNFDLFTGIFR